MGRGLRHAARAIVGLGGAGLAISLALALRTARHYHDEAVTVHLDPTSSARFVAENARLGAPRAERPRVVLFGDSHLDFYDPPLSIDGAEIVNRGQHGDTSAQLLLRLDRDVLALRPSVVLLHIGTNDLKAIGILPDRSAAIEAELVEHVRQLVERMTAAGIQVVLITTLPFGKPSLARRFVWSDAIPPAVARANAAVTALRFEHLRVVDSHAAVANAGQLDPAFARDDIHLNQAGYAALSRAVLPALRESLARP